MHMYTCCVKAKASSSVGQLPQGVYQVSIKYIDFQGQQKGPYTFVFDTLKQRIRWAKQILDTSSWVSFGRHLVKASMSFFFTHLLTHKDAIREIKYSLDNDSLSQSVPFEVWTGAGTSRFSPGEQTSIEAPPRRSLYVLKSPISTANRKCVGLINQMQASDDRLKLRMPALK
jgi:hypothetical protein